MLAVLLVALISPFCPVDMAVLTSPYGRRVHPITGLRSMHRGIDLAASADTPIHAVFSGVVDRVGNSPTWGHNVLIRSGSLTVRYAHASRFYVQIGDQVETGGYIGDVGSSGRATGPHLHLEIMRGGRRIDPTFVLSGC